MAGIGIACQDNVLRYVMERGFWCLSANLADPTALYPPVVCSKTEEDVLLYGGGAVLHVIIPLRVQAEFHPLVPFFGLYPVNHCCSGNRVPYSIKFTTDVISEIKCTCFQYFFCDKGKVLEK